MHHQTIDPPEEQTMTTTLVPPVPQVALPALGADPTAATGPMARRPVAPPAVDIIDQWGMDSFPASDPPSNW